MKRLVFIALLLLGICARADIYVNGVNLNTSDAHYIRLEINGAVKGVLVYVDYGQGESIRNRRVTDEKGEKKLYVSVADALNDFYRNGWAIDEIYTVPGGGGENSSVYGTAYYIMERRNNP